MCPGGGWGVGGWARDEARERGVGGMVGELAGQGVVHGHCMQGPHCARLATVIPCLSQLNPTSTADIIHRWRHHSPLTVTHYIPLQGHPGHQHLL